MDGAAPSEENFEALSVDDRLVHKSWKARLSAYTSLITLFSRSTSEADPIFKSYINNPAGVKEWVRDSNAMSQEKGIEAACALVEYAGKQTARTRSEVIPSVVEKCLGSARAGTKTKAIELCLLYVEVEEDEGQGVMEDVVVGLAAKQPKIVAASITVLREILRSFGPKTVSVKPILVVLSKIFAHADKNVRLEGTLLAVVLHSYLGPALTPSLSDLKPLQIKELTEKFAEADTNGEGFGQIKQSRYTKSQQQAREVKQAAAPEGEVVEEEEEEAATPIDPFEFVAPAVILDALPDDFYTHVNSTKWKDRKDLALDPLLVLLKASPRIQNGNFDELVRALAGRMTDANVVCLVVAANCLEALALGLRTDFGKYTSSVIPPVLERCKEKKANVLDALGRALDAAFLCVTLADIIENVVLFSKHKNPSVKAEVVTFITRSLKVTTTAPSQADTESLLAILLAAFADSSEVIRASAAEGLGTLMKVVGERPLGGQIDSLDDLRKAKVMEAFEKAEVKYKPRSGGAARPTVAPAIEKPIPKPAAPRPVAAGSKPKPLPLASLDDEFAPLAPPKAAPPARMAIKKPPVSSASAPIKKPIVAVSSSSKAAAPSKSSATPAEPLRYKFTQEDAEFQAESVLPAAIMAGLADSNWKARLEAMESLESWLKGGEMATVECELVVRQLAKKPGWKESNFQVGARMFGTLQLLAEESPSFAKASAALTIGPLSDKLGDIKLKKSATDALVTFAEKSSLQFVLSQAYEPMTKQKAPKAQSDGLLFIDQALKDFGIVGVSVRDLIEFLKVGLKSTNAAVRTSATKTLVTLRVCVGADITSFIHDLNPQLLTTIQSEFEKVAGDSPAEPTRVGLDNAAEAVSAGTKGKATEGDALDELFPRADLDKIIPSSSITLCNDANWKNRKEALEGMQASLELNKRLKPSSLPDLTAALKARLADSNKVVQMLALDVVARIATGMGKPFDRHARIFAGSVATVLADQKANIRAAGISTLSAIADAAGLDTLIGALDKPLEALNPILRKELLTWLEARFQDEEVLATLDLTPIVGAIISCLEDKSGEVRKLATSILPNVIARAGYNYVVDQTSKLKPASRSTVLPLVEAARSSVPMSATSSTNSTATLAIKAPVKPLARPGLKPLKRPDSTIIAPQEVARSAASSVAAIRAKTSATTSARSTPVPTSSTLKEPPFKSRDEQPKLVRQSRDVGSLKWNIEGVPRTDQVEALFQQMLPHTSSELHAQLFSKDHNADKDYVLALSTLDDCCKDPTVAETLYDLSTEELKSRLVANVDLIFKYITLRLCLTSTTIAVKSLDLIDHIIPVLADEGHRLSDYEVNALLISLIVKVGDGKETIRTRVRTIFKSLCSLYPFSKVFSVILEHGLVSKNSRTRAECVDELGSLFQRHGVSLFPIAKALPLIARLISDRDPDVRKAALTAIGAVYTLVGGDLVYKHIGTIPDRERTMLEERLKRTTGGGPASPARPVASAPRTLTPSKAVAQPSKLAAPSGISRLPAIRRPAAAAPAPADVAPRRTPPKVNGIPRPVSSPSRRVSPPTDGSATNGGSARRPLTAEPHSPESVHRLVVSIVTDDLSRCADILKLVQAEIISRPDGLIPEADLLVEVLSRQMQLAFTGLARDTPTTVLRLCKHLMQTLSSFFDRKTLGQAVSPDALKVLLAELTGRLLDSAENPASEEIASLSKVLNMVLIRIFHSSDQTACVSALFSILKDATWDLREIDGEELVERAKYAELVMKCLWKVSKTIKESLEKRTLSPARLLRDMDDFLIAIPPAEWRRRHADSIPLTDMPLRTVKTILQQIVSVYGTKVFDELYELEEAENSYVHQYLVRLSSTPTDSAPTAPAPTAVPALPPPPKEPLPPPPPIVGAEIEMNQRLKVIFDLIGDPVHSRVGIAQLYEYQKSNPAASDKIATWMSQTGNYFQTYLKRALDSLASANKERAGTSTPAATISRSASGNSISTSPRAARVRTSVIGGAGGSGSGGSNSPSAKLEDLQSLFGFSNPRTGAME